MINLLYYAVRQYHNGDISLLHTHDHYEALFFPIGSGVIHCADSPVRPNGNSYMLDKYGERVDIGDGSKIVFFKSQEAAMKLKAIPFQNGAVFIFPPGVAHCTDYTGKETRKISFGFSCDDPDSLPFIFEKSIDKTVLSLLNEIDIEFSEKQYRYGENIGLYLSLIMNKLLRSSGKHPTRSDSTTNMKYIINYIGENFSHDVNLNELAKMAGYSPDHFRVLFKKEVGCSPLKYITDRRLDLAKRMIEDISDMTISDIAEYVGYNNYIHFTNIFKEKYGISPSAIRKNKKNEQ